MVTPPVKVLLPDNVSVPLPILVRAPPVPEMTPAMLKLSPLLSSVAVTPLLIGHINLAPGRGQKYAAMVSVRLRK